ncbi:alpha/beta fold hydrolase [Ancylomarina longa]|uniref:Alpha/beta hydrolase n=1 Tax=Ancylomarina longa TaxID=2487017 RepID=A0A434AX35_9BACT|nr:alpha/beta hydrolase [Ancylomarina longa]RUT78996.1 alpha/beta hydrolase [Ancylomarina longa]
MSYVKVKDFRINYEVTCDVEGPTLLLVPGFSEQIDSIEYPKEQCHVFADHGFRVVRMENRDSGYSIPTVSEKHIQPYDLKNLADDVSAVINDLGLETVHLIGASMGGYIARWAAIRHPEQIQTLTIAMSGSGAGIQDDGPQMAQDSAEQIGGYLERRSREDQILWNLDVWRWLWGNEYPFPEEWVKKQLAYSFDRAYSPEGNGRLLQALLNTPALWDVQKTISCPTLVMHGGEDRVFPQEHGEAIAKRISGAEFWLDPKMGHSMHQEQWEAIATSVDASFLSTVHLEKENV